jgi:PAS domain S-box-containing protein
VRIDPTTGEESPGEARSLPDDTPVAVPPNADLFAILDVVDVPIVVVGGDCTLVRFNVSAMDVFGLAPSDIGRLPSSTAALATMDLEKLCRRAIHDQAPVRRDVRTGDRRFLLRIAPSRRGGQIAGAVLTFTNVTAFRASLEQAVYEREYTKTILNTIVNPLVVLDPDLRVQSGNRAFYSMFGTSREGAHGVPLRQLGDDVWRASDLWASLAAIVSDHRDFDPVEIERDFPVLGRRTFLLDARRVSRDEHAPLLLSFQDITESKQAEKARATLAAIVESSHDAIIGTDFDGNITSWNLGAERLLGYAPDDAIGQPVDILLPADRVDEERGILERVRRGDRVDHFETVRRRKDGSLLDISLTVSPIADASGQMVGASRTARDVTERKRADAALVESGRRFRQMVDALPMAVYTTDAEGRITHFNPAAVEFAGRRPVLGSDRWCVTWKLYRPDGTPLPLDECPMAVSLRTGRPVRGEKAIAERPDGERRWFEAYPTPLFDAEGRLTGGINILQDITERKNSEEALQQADRRKDEFLALLAHELRNPLAPIRTGLEVMRLSDDPRTLGRVQSMMERQVSQMVRLIDDLLDVSRIASGKMVLQREVTPLAVLAHHAIEGQRAAIDAKNIALTVDLPEQACLMDVDETRFVQILSNVLHNASKFTPENGAIRFSAKVVDSDGEPKVAITVSDTGVGISQEMLPRVFELFAQVEPTTERAHGGLGIGLALVRRLVDMHGGEITGHSDGPGKGASFTITMPLCAAVEARPSPAPVGLTRVARRVVIIDDNRDAAETMSMLAQRFGAATRTAHDAASGVAAVQEFQPDIVFLDIGMPGMDGYEACRRIRQQASQAAIVIVAVTGWGQSQDKQRALEAGFDAHLTKPVDATSVARLLERNAPERT